MTTITANPIAAIPSRPQTEIADTGSAGFARRAARRLAAFYGWLSGPPMTERQREQPGLFAAENGSRLADTLF